MKPERILDTEIALRILNLKLDDPLAVPTYSTDIWQCYTVINNLQNKGWACNVKSNVTTSGVLSYTARFTKNNLESQFRSTTLPMAICMAALAIAKNEYVEYTKNEKGSPKVDEEAEIVDMKSLLNKANVSPVGVEENPIEDILIDEIASIISNAIVVSDGRNVQVEMSKLLFTLHKKQIISEEQMKSIPFSLAQQIIDKLGMNGYSILKKK